MKIRRGFKAVRDEQERREKEREQRRGKLWRVFFPKNADGDTEIPVRFLTDEPLSYYEHTLNVNGRINNVPCIGDGCPECEAGDKPRFVGAFLVIDRSEFEADARDPKTGKKTGEKELVSDRLKLLVRGQTDLAVLDRHKRKYGLLDRDWNIYKTGKDTSTKWNFERGDKDPWTYKELLSKLPDKYRDEKYEEDGKIDFYRIVEEQILGSVEEDGDSSNVDQDEDDEELEEKVRSGVQKLDESPRKSKRIKNHSNKKRLGKKRK